MSISVSARPVSRSVVFLLTACFGVFLQAQTSPSNKSSSVTPETGFVSATKYTNGFFGFALPLPQSVDFQPFSLSFKGDASRHYLFGLRSERNGLTVFTVTAKAGATSDEDVRKAAAGPRSLRVNKSEIGGREFWKSESRDRAQGGKMYSVTFATAVNNYVLQFNILSFNGKLTDELSRSIQGISFFDPSHAAEVAGPDSRPYSPVAENANTVAMPSSSRIRNLDAGTVSGNTYTNDALGFNYQFPAGWTVNDKATQAKTIEVGHQFVWGNDPAAAREHDMAEQCTKLLLFITQYPEGTKTKDLNPLIMLQAFDPVCAPGVHFPASISDRDTIKMLAQEFMRSLAGTPFASKGPYSVKAFNMQGHVMLDVSGSFVVDAPGRKRLNVFTSIDVTETNGYWVSWGFMSGTPTGLAELKRTTVNFAPVHAQQPAPNPSK